MAYIAKSPFVARRPDGTRVKYQRNQEIDRGDLKGVVFKALIKNGKIVVVKDLPKDVYVPPKKEKKEMPVVNAPTETAIPVKSLKGEEVKDLSEKDNKAPMKVEDQEEREKVVARIDEDGNMDLVETTEDIDLTNPEDLESIKMGDLRKIADKIGAKTSRRKKKIIKNIVAKAKDLEGQG